MRKLFEISLSILKSYTAVIALALFFGIMCPRQTSLLSPHTVLFLQIIFLMASLKMDVREVFAEAKNWKTMILVSAMKLFVIPCAVFLLCCLIVPGMAIPMLLVAAVPSGLTTPVLAEVVGGKPKLALVVTITTSLVAPLSVPLVINMLAGTAVSVSATGMVWDLTKIILFPFLLGQILRGLFLSPVQNLVPSFQPLSLILLGLLLTGTVAKQAGLIRDGFSWVLAFDMLPLFVLTSFALAVGLYMTVWRSWPERVTIAVTMGFISFILAIHLAEFFHDPRIVMKTSLVVFPWILMMIPFKYFVARAGKDS